MTKLKIAIIQRTFKEIGGAEYLILWSARQLIKDGHRVIIITSFVPQSIRDEYPEIEFVITNIGFTKNKLAWIFSAIKISKLTVGYDIINTHNAPTNIIVYLMKMYNRIIRRTNPKVIWYCHEPPANWYGTYFSNVDQYINEHWKGFNRRYFFLKFGYLLDKHAVKKLDLVLTNSKSTKYFVEYCYRENNLSAFVCYPGIPETKFDKVEKPILEDFILSVGRLIYHKGYDKMIDALDYLKKNKKRLKITIVGKGRDERQIREVVISKGLEGYIEFAGYVSEEKLKSLYKRAKFVTLLSKDEPFGLVVLEAMFNKKVFIAHNSGGPSEQIKTGVDGILLDDFSPETIGETYYSYYNNDRELIRMGNNAFSKVINSFTIKKFVERFVSYCLSAK